MYKCLGKIFLHKNRELISFQILTNLRRDVILFAVIIIVICRFSSLKAQSPTNVNENSLKKDKKIGYDY